MQGLPEGFIVDYNAEAPKTPDSGQTVGNLPPGFVLDNNNPLDLKVKPVKKTMKAAQDPVARQDDVTPIDYVETARTRHTKAVQGLVDKSVKDFEALKASSSTSIQNYMQDKITGSELGLQLVGDVANVLSDMVGNVLVAGVTQAGDSISWVLPDSVEKPVADALKEGVQFVGQSAIAQEGIEAAMKGVESWQEFKGANPRAARNIESVVNIGLVVGPLKGSKPQGPVQPVVSTRTRLEKFADEMAAKGAANTKVKTDQKVAATFINFRDPDVMPSLRNGQLKLSPMQQNAVDSLQTVKGFSTNNTATKNLNNIMLEVDKLDDALKTQVANTSGRAHLAGFYDDLTKSFDDAINKSIDKKASSKAADEVFEIVENAVKKHGDSAEGILKARQDLDRWLRTKKGDAAFNKQGPVNDFVQSARNQLNDELALLVPGTKQNLKRQSGLLHASDGLAENASKEFGNKFAAALANVGRLIGTNRDVAFALSALGIGSYSATALPLMTSAVIAGGTYVTLKAATYGISKTVTRKNGAVILKAIDNSIKKAKSMGKDGVAVAKELRLQRAGIVDYLRDMEEVWENGGKERFEAQQAAQAGYENINDVPSPTSNSSSSEQVVTPVPEEPVKADIEVKYPKQTNATVAPSPMNSTPGTLVGKAIPNTDGTISIKVGKSGNLLPATPDQIERAGLAVKGDQVVIVDPVKFKAFATTPIKDA